MKNSLIWRRLLFEDKRYTTSLEITALAKEIGKDPETSLRYLQDQGYIHRLLRGIFYVPTADERERGYLEPSIYELVADALAIKKVTRWYFGLETALMLNGMTHEYFTLDFVITDSFKTTKSIQILDKRFRFLKWTDWHFEFGTLQTNGFSYSDPEKTILDLTYRNYRREGPTRGAFSLIQEFEEIIDRRKLKGYLRYYPHRFQRSLRDAF